MAGTGGRLAGKIYERGGQEAIFTLVADALANPYTARLLLTETARLNKAGKFVFDKRLLEAVRPYQFYVGPRTQVVREGIEEQREIDRIKREGGPFEIIYDPATNEYKRQKIEPRPEIIPSAEPPAPPAPPVNFPSSPSPLFPMGGGASLQVPSPREGTMLSRIDPFAQRQLADTRQRGQEVFGPMDTVFRPMNTVFANKGGIVSIRKKKPRQMVY